MVQNIEKYKKIKIIRKKFLKKNKIIKQYNDNLLNIKRLFINMLLKKGKKNCSEYIFKNVLIDIKKKTKQKPFFVLIKCIENLLPKIKAINIPNKKKKNLKNYKKDRFFLIFLTKNKQIKKSISWIINFKTKNMVDEIILTSKNKGKILNMKKEYYNEIKKLKFNLKLK